MASTFSRVLGQLQGTEQEQIKQLRDQLQRVQEETEDMIRDLNKTIQNLQQQIAQMKEG